MMSYRTHLTAPYPDALIAVCDQTSYPCDDHHCLTFLVLLVEAEGEVSFVNTSSHSPI